MHHTDMYVSLAHANQKIALGSSGAQPDTRSSSDIESEDVGPIAQVCCEARSNRSHKLDRQTINGEPGRHDPNMHAPEE